LSIAIGYLAAVAEGPDELLQTFMTDTLKLDKGLTNSKVLFSTLENLIFFQNSNCPIFVDTIKILLLWQRNDQVEGFIFCTRKPDFLKIQTVKPC